MDRSLTLHAHVLDRETFLPNKRAAGWPRDLADIDALEPGDG